MENWTLYVIIKYKQGKKMSQDMQINVSYSFYTH